MPRKGENIYQRKDKRWEVRIADYRDETGKVHYKSYYFHTYMEAKQKRSELILEQKPTKKMPDLQDNDNFEIICEQWLQSQKQTLKESSFVKYSYIVSNHLMPAFGKLNMKSINVQILDGFFEKLLENGLSPKSVVDIKSVLKRILIYAENQNLPVMCNVDQICIKQEKTVVQILTLEEQRILEDYLLKNEVPLYQGIYLCLYSGLRLGEICALKWEDINLQTNTITINKTMQRIKDHSPSATKKTKIVITPPKSASSNRKIPLPPFVHQKLVKLRNNYSDQAFFLTGKERIYMEPRLVEYHFNKIVKACQFDNINFHMLRHTFATRCVELGFDIKTLSEILGHANVNITLNRYVHPSMDLKRENMKRLEQLFTVR